MDSFGVALRDGSARCVADEQVAIWRPSNQNSLYIKNEGSNEILPVEHFEISYSLRKTIYFGYLTDLPETVVYENIETAEPQVFYSAEDVLKYKGLFTEFPDTASLPVSRGLNFFVLELPQFTGLTGPTVHEILTMVEAFDGDA